MSGGFSFPPPPPPPPKPSDPTSNQYGSAHQQHTGARAHRGGRSGSRGESRGRGQSFGRGNGFQQASHQRGGFSASSQSPRSQAHRSQQADNYNTAERSPSQSQSAQGAINAFPNGHRDNVSHPRTVAGHKRKLDALKPPSEKPKKPGPPTAPAVPSFGAPIVSPKPPPTQATLKHVTAASARKSLGLTPAAHGAVESNSDSEPDVLDEEAMYAELGDKLTFEHNGEVMSLRSQADLAAWRKERRKNWPTKARMVEKDDERRRIGEERRRLLRIATPAQPLVQAREAKSKQPANDGSLENLAANQDERASRLSELRKKVLESEAKNRQAKVREVQSETVAEPPNVPLGSAGNRATEAVTVSALIGNEELPGEEGEAAVQSSDEESDDTSSDSSADSPSDSDSDDDAPEEVTSKPSETQSDLDARPVCRAFASRGYCNYGDACHFKHETPTGFQAPSMRQRDQRTPRQNVQADLQSSGRKKGIFERLKEQEREAEDRMALQVIKYLGKAGFFNDE